MQVLAQSGNALLPALILAMVGYLILMSFYARKNKRNYQQMLTAIKKNDRVMTIGGIIGSVVSTTPDEVVVKVDESANVKITFLRSAIKKVLTEDPKAADLQ